MRAWCLFDATSPNAGALHGAQGRPEGADLHCNKDFCGKPRASCASSPSSFHILALKSAYVIVKKEPSHLCRRTKRRQIPGLVRPWIAASRLYSPRTSLGDSHTLACCAPVSPGVPDPCIQLPLEDSQIYPNLFLVLPDFQVREPLPSTLSPSQRPRFGPGLLLPHIYSVVKPRLFHSHKRLSSTHFSLFQMPLGQTQGLVAPGPRFPN